MYMPLYKDWQYAIQARMALEVYRPFGVFLQLIKSNGWIYPIKGFIFFWENYQKLLPIFLSVVLPYTVLHFYVYTILIFAILPINLIICVLTTGPIGVQIAAFQSFQQCSCLNTYIFKNYLIKGKLNKVFDTTLCINGLDRIVIPGKLKRLVPQTLGAQLMEINMINLIIFLSSSIYSICISSIPILGTISIYYNTAIKTAELSQQRMWQLTRQRPRQVRYHIKENEGEFLMFGMTCQLLESLPVLGLLFCFTNHVGAALLATDIYKRSTSRG